MEAQGTDHDVEAVREAPASQPEFTIPATRTRRLGELVMGGWGGVYLLLWLFSPPNLPGYQWFFVPFLALFSLHFTMRAFDRRARLTVDGEGITDRTALILGPLRIGWEEVVRVSSDRFTGTVELALRDLGDLEKRAGPARRLWILLRRLRGKRTISITPMLLGMKKQELESRLSAALDCFEHAQLVAAKESPQVESGEAIP